MKLNRPDTQTCSQDRLVQCDVTKNETSKPPSDSAVTSTADMEGKEKSTSTFRSAVTHLMCGMYAILILVLGFVLPISSALTHNGNQESFYVDIFHLYIYLMSLSFLIYIHAYVLRQGQKPKKQPTSSISMLSNNRLHEPADQNNAECVEDETNLPKEKRSPPTSVPPSEVDFEMQDDALPAVTFDSQGVNFYLRLGAIGFGTGSMIHDGFKIAELFEGQAWSRNCRGPLQILVAVMHMLFTFCQTFYIFKNHRIVINMHKALVRFGMMHIMATNLCIWFLTTTAETAEDFGITIREGKIDEHSAAAVLLEGNHHQAEKADNNSCEYVSTLATRAGPYLFPCTIEYSLIAAAVIYKMYQNVGRIGLLAITDYPEDDRPNPTECHKAHKGLFMGLFIAMITLISVSCFFVFGESLKRDHTASLIFYGTEIILLVVASSVVVLGFAKLQQLQFTHLEDTSIDTPLLITSLFGLYIFYSFILVSSVGNIYDYGVVSILSLTTSILAMVQSGIQTVFILDGLRRCALHAEQAHAKPGRALVTFLLLTNLSLWAINTFEVKKAQSMPLHTAYYGHLAWGIMSHACIPMLIFFRFHSTVCLSDIWVNAYTIKHIKEP